MTLRIPEAGSVRFDADLIRNIKGIRTSQDLFDDLSSSPEDWDLAIAVEQESNVATHQALIHRPFDYGVAVAYVFDPSHWNASRFSDGRHYGVWYGSLDLETTLHETVYHWHRFVMDSFPDLDRPVTGERRVCDVHCKATLVDLRGAEAHFPELVSRTDYLYTQPLGAFYRSRGDSGLLVKSARCEGVNAALFDPAALSNVRDRCFLTYRCHPAADIVEIERVPGKRFMQLQPSLLY